MSKKLKVLFLCTGNSCRSQMAEAFLREKCGQRFEVLSAGITPEPIHPLTIKVMKEKGLDISHYQSNDIKDYLGKIDLDYVIIVCDKAGKTCPRAWPELKNSPLYWPFEDPVKSRDIDIFRKTRDLIELKIEYFIDIFGCGECRMSPEH